jgi:hypothetical protein
MKDRRRIRTVIGFTAAGRTFAQTYDSLKSVSAKNTESLRENDRREFSYGFSVTSVSPWLAGLIDCSPDFQYRLHSSLIRGSAELAEVNPNSFSAD